MAAKGRTLLTLCDIGNLVTFCGIDGKPIPQVSRPVTRRAKKFLLSLMEHYLLNRGAVPKPAQKKAISIPKPVAKPKEVTEIRPGTKEKWGKKHIEISARKKIATLTATLNCQKQGTLLNGKIHSC